MPVVRFFGKPGCVTNRKQKALLRDAGFVLDEVDLLKYPWGAGELANFFADREVAEWFNPAAPRVRDGQLDPEGLTASEALDLLLEEPLLIRRPLLEYDEGRMAGFDMERVQQLLGTSLVSAGDAGADAIDKCSRTNARESCP